MATVAQMDFHGSCSWTVRGFGNQIPSRLAWAHRHILYRPNPPAGIIRGQRLPFFHYDTDEDFGFFRGRVMAPPVWIIRSTKERKERCTIWPLRGHPLVRLVGYPFKNPPEVGEATLLWTEGPPLSAADAGRPLLLLDASWRRAQAMRTHFPGLVCRSLGGISTAYPRCSRLGTDPDSGLATVEALYAACWACPQTVCWRIIARRRLFCGRMAGPVPYEPPSHSSAAGFSVRLCLRRYLP